MEAGTLICACRRNKTRGAVSLVITRVSRECLHAPSRLKSVSVCVYGVGGKGQLFVECVMGLLQRKYVSGASKWLFPAPPLVNVRRDDSARFRHIRAYVHPVKC